MMKRIYAALCGALLLVSPAWGQSSKATLNTLAGQTFPDNTGGGIAPSTVRTYFGNLIASFQQAPLVNPQTGTTYTIQASDYGLWVAFNNASAVAVTLPAPSGSFANGFNFNAVNNGAGVVTITPQSGTIGGNSSFTLSQGQSAWITSDGGNYQLAKGFGSGTVTSITQGTGLSFSATPCISTCTITLANPSASTLGGIQSVTCGTTSWVTTISTAGVPTCSGLDTIGSTQGSVLFRGAAGWQALTPGSSGQVLQSGGPAANPSWLTVTGTGTVTSVGSGVGLTGGPVTGAGTLSLASAPECGRLAFSSTTAITFTPFRCELTRIGGTVFAIPSAGIAGCTNTSAFVNGTGASSLAASTFYYVYEFSNSGTLTCDFRTDGNGHRPSQTAGNLGTETRISAGTTEDTTRSLIGMVLTNASSQFQDSSTCLCTASWFNRKFKTANSGLTTATAVPNSLTGAEVSSGLRLTFLMWADASIAAHINAICNPAAVANADCRVWADFDSGTTEDASGYGQAWGTTQDAIPFSINMDKTGLTEAASHYFTMFAGTNNATAATFLGATAPATRTTLWVRIYQ